MGRQKNVHVCLGLWEAAKKVPPLMARPLKRGGGNGWTGSFFAASLRALLDSTKCPGTRFIAAIFTFLHLHLPKLIIVELFQRLFLYFPVRPSFFLFVQLSIYLYVCLSVSLFPYLSIALLQFVHLSINIMSNDNSKDLTPLDLGQLNIT